MIQSLKWKKQINVRSIILENQSNESPEHIADISVRIAKLIRASVSATYFDVTHNDYCIELDEVIDSMENCTIETLAEDKELSNMEAVDMINDWLQVLYDWADRNRIWLGGK